jgi:MarR family transcriptional regulator, temperature-dependent positive regulator of motility
MTDRTQRVNRSPMHLMHQAEQAAERIFAARAMSSATPRQLAALIAVAEKDGSNQADVAERTGIDRATLGEIIVRLVRNGFLQRRRSREDARAKLLRLTDRGRRLLDAAQLVEDRVDAVLLAALPAAERKPFLAALQAIVRNLEAAR